MIQMFIYIKNQSSLHHYINTEAQNVDLWGFVMSPTFGIIKLATWESD